MVKRARTCQRRSRGPATWPERHRQPRRGVATRCGPHDLHFSNRPVRTRMPGSVGGARSAMIGPYPVFRRQASVPSGAGYCAQAAAPHPAMRFVGGQTLRAADSLNGIGLLIAGLEKVRQLDTLREHDAHARACKVARNATPNDRESALLPSRCRRARSIRAQYS